MGKAPVLFLTFTKVETTKKVFEAIAAYQPDILYIAQDGPRKNNPGDKLKTDAVSAITQSITWDCKVVRWIQTENLGLKAHVEGAITRFFEIEKEGIILEDDTLPTPDFFLYCEELLERYRYDKRIFVIGGTNFNISAEITFSYFYCEEPIIWGWATWADRWKFYNTDLSYISLTQQDNSFKNLYHDPFRQEVELGKIDALKQNLLKSWATRWGYSIKVQNGLCILPTKNLVRNIGFGDDASNTLDEKHPFSKLQHEQMQWPMAHPDYIIRSQNWEEKYFYPGQNSHRYISFKEILLCFYYKVKAQVRGNFKNLSVRSRAKN